MSDDSEVIGVPRPAWLLRYGAHGSILNISPLVLGVTYTDKLEHSASEIEVAVEDRAHRFQSNPPVKGDTLQLEIGYDNAPLMPCGSFQIDELQLKGPPDVFFIKGIGAAITPDLRTHYSRGYEGQSLKDIATGIAAAHGYTVVDAPETQVVTLNRVTQKHETDLQFLRRLALLYNYDFSIHGQQLVFIQRTDLENAAAVATLTRATVTRFDFTQRTNGIYKRARVSHTHPRTKQVLSATVDADPPVATGDELKLAIRAESEADARAKAAAALHGYNKDATTMAVSGPGDPQLMSGFNVAVTGFGAYDGTYHIQQSRHAITRAGGYTTDLEARRLAQ